MHLHAFLVFLFAIPLCFAAPVKGGFIHKHIEVSNLESPVTPTQISFSLHLLIGVAGLMVLLFGALLCAHQSPQPQVAAATEPSDEIKTIVVKYMTGIIVKVAQNLTNESVARMNSICATIPKDAYLLSTGPIFEHCDNQMLLTMFILKDGAIYAALKWRPSILVAIHEMAKAALPKEDIVEDMDRVFRIGASNEQTEKSAINGMSATVLMRLFVECKRLKQSNVIAELCKLLPALYCTPIHNDDPDVYLDHCLTALMENIARAIKNDDEESANFMTNFMWMFIKIVREKENENEGESENKGAEKGPSTADTKPDKDSATDIGGALGMFSNIME